MFCAPELIFGGTEAIGALFHVMRSGTHFRRYHGRRVPFSCFGLRDSFSTVPRASGPVFMFCAPEVVFGDAECVGSHFSCFGRPNSFAAVQRASGPVYMFCAPGLVFSSTEGVEISFLPGKQMSERCVNRRHKESLFHIFYLFQLRVTPSSGRLIEAAARPAGN
jgi:hypothetical protein